LGKQDAFSPLSEVQLTLVMLFSMGNTLITNITRASKFPLYSREKWLVLPTYCVKQNPTVKSKPQNSVLSGQKPHQVVSKNAGETADYPVVNSVSCSLHGFCWEERIQKHQQAPSSVPPTFWIPAVFGSEESNIFFIVHCLIEV